MPKPLRPGTKIEFISRHLGLTNDKLIEKAKAEGIELNKNVIDSTRWHLKVKHGFKNTGSKGNLKLREKYKAKGSNKKKKTKKKQDNGVSPARAMKHAQLRKLVFELGYDEVRDIFEEFQDMHSRLEG